MFFFFNDTATTEIYTLSLHDALPIWLGGEGRIGLPHGRPGFGTQRAADAALLACGDDILMLAADPDVANERRLLPERSEEHTSELQSQSNLVCRLLLEKKHQHYIVLL